METRETLCAAMGAGRVVDFLFFWGHTPKSPSAVDASCLSQWFAAPFTLEGVRYATAEHYMMAEKARLFDDAKALASVLASTSPADAKAIGRTVQGYDDARWAATRSEAVVRGNVAKFGQNEALLAFLRGTGERVLVEAAPRDVVWGIGLGASNPKARDPSQWRGRNLLGFALMEARRVLSTRR